MLTLNRSRRIIKCVVIGVLFTCVLLGLSSAPIFAASEEVDSPSSSEVSSFDLVVPEEYSDPVYEKLAAGDVRATYTVSDVYVLLSSALVGESNSSTYSLPRIAYYTWQTWSRLNTTNNRLSDILSALADGNSSNIPVGPGIRQTLFGIDGQGNWETVFDTSQDTRDLAQLIYSSSQQIHADGQNNTYYLSQIASSLSSPLSWSSFPLTYVNTSLSLNGSALTSNTTSSNFYVKFQSSWNINQYDPNLVRLFIPLSYRSGGQLNSIYSISGFYNGSSLMPISDYFFEIAENGVYLYLFDFHPYGVQNYSFNISTSRDVTFLTSPLGSASYISFNTDDYQQIKQAFYQQKSSNSIVSISDSVSSLANYLVSPEKQAAENASQAVIDDTLDGFTGNGSAAAKTSDTGSMKNMSGSIQSGLDSGASASNAASVFSNQSFWSWFTQATSNGINNPYPAPVVQNVRGSGDEVPDFLSGNQAELNELLNQRNSW